MLTKMVNGKEVVCSAEEEAEIRAEWAANAAKAQRVLIPSSVIVDRLQQDGLLEKARAALDAAPLYARERWNTRTAIYADDPDTIALLKSIGADPQKILAPENTP